MNAFKECIERMGKCENLTTDNEPSMMGKVFQNYLKKNNIIHYAINPTEQKHNMGLVERLNRSIREVLRKYMSANKTLNWSDAIKDLNYNYNHTYHTGVRNIPIEIWEGKEMNRQDIKVSSAVFEIGDIVRYRKKFGFLQKVSASKLWSKNLYEVVDLVSNKYMIRKMSDRSIKHLKSGYDLLKVDDVEDYDKKETTEHKKQKQEVKQISSKRKLDKEMKMLETDATQKFTETSETKRKSKKVEKLDL